jgi:signal transduction histidine kinase
VQEARRGELERELLKRRFVTFVSHQLKSPLVAVHQYLEVLKRLGDTDEVRPKREMWLDRCLERTDELTSIIEDWLTLASLEQASFSRTREIVDVRSTISKLVEGYEGTAAERSVALTADLPASPCPVSGDPTCLTVLFDNLIVNAIRYNRPGGSVIVRAECRPGEVVVSVADTGIGIPESCLPMLFDEFFRVGGRSEGSSGTGLGLPISRRIATEHGGVIDVQSVEGSGSTFTVRLPRHEMEGAPDAAGADTALEEMSLS